MTLKDLTFCALSRYLRITSFLGFHLAVPNWHRWE
eukprot:UN10408